MNGNILLFALILLPMAGAFLTYLVGRKSKEARDYVADAIVILEFILALFLFIGYREELQFSMPEFCVQGLYLKLDGFRSLYVLVAAFMWMMTTIFTRQYMAHYRNRNRYYLFTLLTLGATAGVFLSADLYTTFIFFEIMSFTSYVWVAQEEKKEALRAADTYLAVAVIGGLVMLMGLFLLYHLTGTLNMDALPAALASAKSENMGLLYLAGALMLFGFGAKAGMFPLHIWLPKAHPVAPAPASALLSGILTKSGIFGILVISSDIFLHDAMWGYVILLLGVITMFGGALLALFSIDLKRTLACSSMSQVGFILVGVGMGGLLGEEGTIALRGTVLHMVNHSLIKLALFMAAGVVVMNLHKLDLNAIRGFGRKKPLLNFVFLMGALGIGGIPLWNGYISKTLLHEGIVEYTYLLAEGGHGLSEAALALTSVSFMKTVEWIFLITGGMTIAYMLKLYICLFIEKNADQAKMDASNGHYMDAQSSFALAGSAVLLPIMGFLPTLVMDPLADRSMAFLHGGELPHAVEYFSLVNLKGAAISIAIGAFLYFVVVRLCLMKKNEQGVREYVNLWPAWLDIENTIYRPILINFLPFVCALVCRCLERLLDGIVLVLQKYVFHPVHPLKPVVGTKTTYIIGNMADSIENFLNRTIFRKSPKNMNFVVWLAERERDVKQLDRIITRSVSFGLLTFAVGLCLTIAYLLFM